MKDFEAIITVCRGESYNFRTFGSKPVVVPIVARFSGAIYIFWNILLPVAEFSIIYGNSILSVTSSKK